MLMRRLLRSSGCISSSVRWCSSNISGGSSHHSSLTPPVHNADAMVDQALPSSSMPYMEPYITTLSNPSEHTEEQRALYYTIPREEYETIFSGLNCTSLNYQIEVATFNEASLMVRRPALSVIRYIKELKLDAMTPPKFMFYGAGGTGMTCSIAHVTHFLNKDGFVIVMVPWVDRWLKQFRKKPAEVLESGSVPGRWDHTTDAADWLKFFRTQNLSNFANLDLPISKKYEFSTRESCDEGSPLMGIAELGVARPGLAADCVMALTTELRQFAVQGRCKLALVMDGINSVFTESSIYKREDFDFYTKENWSYIPADCFTIVQAMTNLLNNDWTNGVIVGSIDNRLRKDKDRSSYLPRYVLGEKGWNTLDPFVPVPVPEYDAMEFKSAIAYYASKHWIQKHDALTPDGIQELSALSGNNPHYLSRTCASL